MFGHNLSTFLKMPFYAVARGRNVGIYHSWAECECEVKSFKGAIFKKFNSEEDAKKFIDINKNGKGLNIGNLPSSTIHAENKELYKLKADFSSLKNYHTALDYKLRKMEGKMDNIESKDITQGSINTESLKRPRNKNVMNKKPKLEHQTMHSNGFTIDSDGYLIVHTDGSCLFNGRNGAKAGLGVYFGPNHPLNVSEPVKGRATNNTAEIQAATAALKLAKSNGFQKIQLNSDSKFLINCVTQWLPKWKVRNWKKVDGKDVINKDDLVDLDEVSKGLNIQWKYVKAHVGIRENEAADALARAGSDRYKA